MPLETPQDLWGQVLYILDPVNTAQLCKGLGPLLREGLSACVADSIPCGLTPAGTAKPNSAMDKAVVFRGVVGRS